jgi:hypothetical protein
MVPDIKLPNLGRLNVTAASDNFKAYGRALHSHFLEHALNMLALNVVTATISHSTGSSTVSCETP